MTEKANTRRPGCVTNYTFWKDIYDRFFALLALLVSLPVLAAIAIAIRLDSRGNPVFSQERIGKNGRKFTLYKFRTMHQEHDDTKYQEYMKQFIRDNSAALFDEDGHDKFELIDDPRITRVGGLLRRLNLDELPQLINILKGDMSFVGPRPEVAFALKYYEERHKKKFQVKPGITGMWQTIPDRRRVTFEDTINLDNDYINRLSLFLDIKIILLTVFEIFTLGSRQKGVDEINLATGMKNGISA